MDIVEMFTLLKLLSEEGIYSVWLLLQLFSGGKNEGVCKTKSNFIRQLRHFLHTKGHGSFWGFDDQGISTIISQKLRFH